jgi:hypothetical protein
MFKLCTIFSPPLYLVATGIRTIQYLFQLDIMFHNAGQSQRAQWENIDIAVDRTMFELNVFSIVNLTRIVIPHFLENGKGTFAVMSSAAGKLGSPFSGSYTGTKHALQVVHLRAVYPRVFCICCPVHDGLNAQQLLLLFSRDHVREKQRKQLGGGAIADWTTDAKNGSVDGP